MSETSSFFLSHNAKGRTAVERWWEDGVKVWFDEWALKPGSNQGLAGRSRVLVLCMSPNVFGWDWVQLERDTFRFRGRLHKEDHFLPHHFILCGEKSNRVS